MAWPNNNVQYAYDSNGNVAGLVSGSSIDYFSYGLQVGMPLGIPPAGTIGSNGALTLGTQPGGGTITFGATSGSTTATLSVAGFAATDVGRVITVDSGKQATITAFTSTTVVTVTLGSTLSGVGPFATWYMAWAFPYIYSNMYLYFPINAIYSGSAAGYYYTAMTSTTVGVVYDNRFLGAANEIPVIPSPLAFSGRTGIAYTQDTTPISGVSFTIVAGRMGKNGRVTTTSQSTRSKDTNTVAYLETFNAQNTYIAGLAGSSSSTLTIVVTVQNRGREDIQITTQNQLGAVYSGTTQPYRIMTHNTASSDIQYTSLMQITTQGTWIVTESYALEVSPAL